MYKTVKRVVVVYDYAYINGGAAKIAIQSGIALSESGYDVTFFSAVGPTSEELQNSDVRIKCLDINDINHGSRVRAIKDGIWNKYVYEKFSLLLDEYSPIDTIVHIHGWVKALSPAVIKAADEKGFRIIVTLHDYFTICPNGGLYNYHTHGTCHLRPMSLACKMCNCDKRNYGQKMWRIVRQYIQDKYVRNNPNIGFISLSEKSEKLLRPYTRGNHYYRVINPIELANIKVDDCSRSSVFIYVGRISEEKGVELFCKAISEIGNIKGVVIGDGELKDKISEQYKNVDFVGWKSHDEVMSYMLKARALVFPSKWYEVAPLTVLESLSAALPVIISDCTTATEIVKEGENGFVFHSNDVESLKDKIKESMNDIGIQNIQSRILTEFDNDKYDMATHVDALGKVYNEWLNAE